METHAVKETLTMSRWVERKVPPLRKIAEDGNFAPVGMTEIG